MTKEKYPNILFIIGNGFDLAHGMRTSYYHFLLWYLNEINSNALKKVPFEFEDKLVKFENKYVKSYEQFRNFDDFNGAIRQKMVHIEYKNLFFKNLVESCSQKNWVDIEYTYFQEILNYYKKFEIHGNKYLPEVTRINECLDDITCYLSKYLKTLEFPGINQKIRLSLWNAIRYEGFANACFLVFNYTDTVESYLYDIGLGDQFVINIHGQLNNPANPIIFGYGDEMISYYSKIEDLNENEYLKHMKSFGYFKTPNYQNLLRFIDADAFKVCIMGHSCGLSDRVLLNTIFCHKKCKEIQIYYHQKGPGITDFDQKTMEISRHFKAADKVDMRKKIVSFDKSSPLS